MKTIIYTLKNFFIIFKIHTISSKPYAMSKTHTHNNAMYILLYYLQNI